MTSLLRQGFTVLYQVQKNYYFRRVAMAFIVFVAGSSIAFALYQLLPGGPAQVMKQRLLQQAAETSSSTADFERVNMLVEAYTGVHPGKPMHIAYFEYVRDIVLYQDFGKSIWKNEPVFDYLFAKMPWSIFLSVYGLVLGRTAGLLLGAGMAYKEGSLFDSGLTTFSIANRTVPYYIVAILSIIAFAYIWPIFPTGGRYSNATTPGFNVPFMASVMYHGALPVLTTFIAGFGGALAFRGNCIREMGKDYLRVARFRGISNGRIALRYVGRNAILPVYTGLMMGIASIFSSGIIIETIFNYPGIGYATFSALMNRDYPLLMGSFVFYTGLTVLGLLIADLTYGIIDPRIQSGGERESY